MKISKYILMAAIAVPFDSGQWQTLSYSSLPKHKLSFEKGELEIKVKKSAMPLIYPLESQQKISSICIKGKKTGKIDLKNSKLQGQKGSDDFVIRLGLVEKGDETLNWFQRKIAASWVLKLFSLAKDNEGINKIHFFTAVQDKSLLENQREHPLGKGLMLEKNIWYLKASQSNFEFSYKLDKAIESLAIWLSVDGDDTNSEFTLKLHKLELNCID